jgi:hypothetical protein
MTAKEFDEAKARFLESIKDRDFSVYGLKKPTAESLTAGTRAFHEKMAAHAERKGDTKTAAKARRAASLVR